MQPSLSIAVLTHNERDNIEKCLASVAWANEIVMIDNSTDDTLERARRVISSDKLRIIKSTSQNFADLRNEALHLVRHEWVLYIDADEVVSEKLKEEILDELKHSQADGYKIKRDDYFLGRWLKFGETQNVRLLKLGRRSKGKWTRRVHEVWEIEDDVGFLTQPIKHYPHPTSTEFLERISRWTTLDASEFAQQGERSSWWKIIVYPCAKFVLNYGFRQGFRDRMPGLIFAIMMSWHSFLTRAKLYLLTS